MFAELAAPLVQTPSIAVVFAWPLPTALADHNSKAGMEVDVLHQATNPNISSGAASR